MKLNIDNKSYISPEIEAVKINFAQLICVSNTTEGITLSGNSFDEDDFTEWK